VKYDYGENVTFQGDLAIHLDTHFSKLINDKEIQKGSNNFELYSEEDNLEELNKRLITCNVKFIHPLKEQPCQKMVIRFYDPDMNIIEVGESMVHTAKQLSSIGNPKEHITELMSVPITQISQWLSE